MLSSANPTNRRKPGPAAGGRSGRRRDLARPRDGTSRTTKRDRLLGLFGPWPRAGSLQRADARPLAHRERRPLHARHKLRRGCLAHPREPRHRRARSLAYDPRRAGARENVKNARWRAALDIKYILEIPGSHWSAFRSNGIVRTTGNRSKSKSWSKLSSKKSINFFKSFANAGRASSDLRRG